MKSGPTSGPLTVSSQVTQDPHGIRPPEQFIIVPLMLVYARRTSPVRLTWTVVVPPRACGVVGRTRAEGGSRVVDLVVADQHDVVAAVAEGAHAVVPAGQRRAVVEHDRRLGVVEGAVVEPRRHVQPDLAVTQVGDAVDQRRPLRAMGGGRCRD